MNYENFFMLEVPQMLNKLEEDTRPEWGEMNAKEMLDHLRKGVAMSMKNVARKIQTSKDQLPAYKKFLISDKPLQQGRSMPAEYNKIPSYEGDFLDLKVNLMRTLIEMQVFFKNNPDFSSIHPSFGRLNCDEWLKLHHKHITHHFTQFGIYNPEK